MRSYFKVEGSNSRKKTTSVNSLWITLVTAMRKMLAPFKGGCGFFNCRKMTKTLGFFLFCFCLFVLWPYIRLLCFLFCAFAKFFHRKLSKRGIKKILFQLRWQNINTKGWQKRQYSKRCIAATVPPARPFWYRMNGGKKNSKTRPATDAKAR